MCRTSGFTEAQDKLILTVSGDELKFLAAALGVEVRSLYNRRYRLRHGPVHSTGPKVKGRRAVLPPRVKLVRALAEDPLTTKAAALELLKVSPPTLDRFLMAENISWVFPR